jgi:hypothetical protein
VIRKDIAAGAPVVCERCIQTPGLIHMITPAAGLELGLHHHMVTWFVPADLPLRIPAARLTLQTIAAFGVDEDMHVRRFRHDRYNRTFDVDDWTLVAALESFIYELQLHDPDGNVVARQTVIAAGGS